MYYLIIFFAFIVPIILITTSIVLFIVDWNKPTSSVTSNGPFIEHWLAHPPIQGNDYTYNYLHELEPEPQDDHFIEKNLYEHWSDAVWK